MKSLGALTLLATLAFGLMKNNTNVRDTINVVGSSTIYPFSTVVAERFGKLTPFKTPKIESTGTGSGMKLFCDREGVDSPDIVNASRRMKKGEFEICQKNGVSDITEVLIGYDGIVIANAKAKKGINFTLRELFLALAKKVPSPDGSQTWIANPYHLWSDIAPRLPARPIEVLGPSPTSGTRDTFNELVLEGGCKTFAWIKAIEKQDKFKYKSLCRSIREDGKYIEVGESDYLMIQKLKGNANAFGVLGFSFLDQNRDELQGSKINGVEPTIESIANHRYIISRGLFFYVKNGHIGKIPGIQEFLSEFTGSDAIGEEGYLSDKGLIPLSSQRLSAVRKNALAQTSVSF